MFKRAMGAFLLGVATQGWALSLGASSGAVTIGQPLDVQVRTAADAAEWASGLCIQAEVYFGETRLPGAAIELVTLPGSGESGAVRLRSRAVVNEPVVTVVLSAGCADKFSRRYVFLSDLEPVPSVVTQPALAPVAAVAAIPSEVASPTASTAASLTAPSGGAALAPPPSSTNPIAPPVNGAAALPPTPRAAPAKPKTSQTPQAPAKKPVASAPASPKPPVVAPASAAGPRLKLEPVDLAPARIGQPALKAQSELLTEPSADEARRGEARDAWAALNASPSDLAAEREKVANLEKQLDQVRQEQQRMQASIESMNAQWREAQAQRYQNPLVYGLVLSLLVALGLWWRARRASASAMGQGAWWESTQAPANSVVPSAFPKAQGDTQSPDSLLDASDSVMAAGLHAVEDPPEEVKAFSPPAAKPVSIDQLLDMVQQVDFFESLGQIFDAQRVLKDFVSSHPAACELPYLLWLRHAKEMGDTAQRVEVARIYQHDFKTEPPPSSLYGRQAPGLETDTAYLAELSKVWDSAEALPQLERALLSTPGADGPLKVRTLEAFEDLFTLYAVAQALLAEPATSSADAEVNSPSPAQASASAMAFAPTAAMDLAWQPAPEVPVQTAPLIDLDLTGLSPSQPTQTSAPVVEPSGNADTTDTRELPSLDFDFDLDAVSGKTPLDKPRG